MTKKDLSLRIQIQELERITGEYEIGKIPAYDAYQRWLKIPAIKQAEIRAKWDEYYKLCSMTKSGLEYRIRIGRMRGRDVSELEAMTPVPTPDKPYEMDIEEMMNEMVKYFTAKKKLEQLKKELRAGGNEI